MSILIIKKPTSSSTDNEIGSILTIFDEKNSSYIVFDDGTILVGST